MLKKIMAFLVTSIKKTAKLILFNTIGKDKTKKFTSSLVYKIFNIIGEERTNSIINSLVSKQKLQIKDPNEMRFTYDADGLKTVHNSDFLHDPAFMAAYEAGMKNAQRSNTMHAEWRAYVTTWVANHVKYLKGDYVECGCWTGIAASFAATYINFKDMKHKTFYLFDTFEGIVIDRLTEVERMNKEIYLSKNKRLYYDFFEITKKNLKDFDNIKLIKGIVPDILSSVTIEKVCYLYIDMNAAHPEVKALEYFWEKLVLGGVVVLDDYAFVGHQEQKKAFDLLSKKLDFSVLALPTGQGLIFKK